MWRLLMIMIMATANQQSSFASEQTTYNMSEPIGIMTTSAGSPIEYRDATSTLNSNLIFNEYFMDSLTHIVRERRPERVVHAKAAGAFGYFEVTHDITNICKAKFLSAVGKKTPVVARLSSVLVEKGGIDTSRDARGFALKFYTEEGNFDIVGFNTPMYGYKDPILFSTFVRAQKKRPATNLIDDNTFWDFLTLRPESLHMFLLILGDRGIPDGYRHMPGYSIHTYQVVNKYGEKSFIRFHILPDAGIRNLRSKQARKIAGCDPDYATRDLYNAISKGKFPSWTIYIQILSLEDVQSATFDVFDVTRVLPMDKYPLKPLGRFVLNKNVLNYFAEIEQLAFSPANLVPGILGGPDKLFEGRRLAYREAQYYRLGANFNKISVNCPMRTKTFTYNRDGRPPVNDNGMDISNYYPNTYDGPVPYVDENRVELINIFQDNSNNFEQVTELYVNEMTKEERSRVIENILYKLKGVSTQLKDKVVKLFTIIHPDLGRRVHEGLALNRTTFQEEEEEDYDYC